MYSKAGIKDPQTEANLWCLESAFKAGLIIAGKRKVDIELFERIFDSLGGKEMAKFDLIKEAKHLLGVCHGLQKWGKRLKAGVPVNYEEMLRSFGEYKEVCSNINIGESIEHVKKSLAIMDKLLKKADKPLPLGELKDLRDKLRRSNVSSEKQLGNLETRIFVGESLIKSISQLSDQQLAQDFEMINQEYDKCQVTIPRFEEILAKHAKEEHFVKNIETIVAEIDEINPLDKIKKLREEFSNFTFCKYCEVELYLAHKEVEIFKSQWKSYLSRGMTKDQARNHLLDDHALNLAYFEAIESDLCKIRDKIRLEIQLQIGKKSKRPILCDIMKSECDQLQENLLFLRTIYTKKDGLKSGKTSVFEKSCECFLENYKLRSSKLKNSVAGAKKSAPLKEDDLRKLFVAELKKIFESMDIFGVAAGEIGYVAKDLEQGVFFKLLDKNRYEKMMHQIIQIFMIIKKQGLNELARHIRKNEFSPQFLIKLSQKPIEFLPKLENKLCVLRDNKRRSMFTNKYLAPFEDTSLIDKKIRKLKPMEEFDGYSDDDKEFGDEGTDSKIPRAMKPEVRDEPYIPVDDIADKASINADDDEVESNVHHIYRDKTLSEGDPGSDKKETALVYYRIYSGKPSIDIDNSMQMVGFEMFSTSAPDFIRKFTRLPLSLSLGMKVKRREYESYMEKVLFNESRYQQLI